MHQTEEHIELSLAGNHIQIPDGAGLGIKSNCVCVICFISIS